MLLNYSENEKLFAKSVPVSLKDMYTNQTRTCHLFLTIEWQDASAGLYSSKVLVISLTDNNDPFFLYNLHLSEEDFEKLKTSQGLLINFASFPQHIIGFLEKCLFEERNPQPKFLLLFSIDGKFGNVASSSQFDVIAPSEFKNLIHLSLQFVAASESATKQYISTCFKKLKEENRQLQMNLTYSEQDKKDKLIAKELALNSKEQELENFRKQYNEELAMKESKHSQELQQERSRLLEKLKEEENRFEREKKEKDQQFQKEILNLESRVTVLDTLSKELQEKNYKHESTIRSLKSTILSLEDENRNLTDNIQSCQLKCDNLQSEIKDKQKHINYLDGKIKDLQQEIRKETHSSTKLKIQIDSEIKDKKSLERELEHLKLQLEMSEKSRKILDKDKDELNEVILNLQANSKKAKSKIELATKYKQTIDEKEKILENLKKETQDLNEKLEAKNSEIRSLTNSVTTLENKIDDLKKEIIVKGHVIKYLNKELTENNIIPQYPDRYPVTSPSNIAQKQLAKISSAGQNAQCPDFSPSGITSTKITSKSVRVNTPVSVCRKSASVPNRLKTEATDSAYGASPSSYTNQVYLHSRHDSHDVILDQEADFDTDHFDAFKAAFEQGDQPLKHSTAKKSTKPVQSTTPKVLKKR